LLLGSGVSRAAGMPTGWDVTLDLVGKLSSAVGEAEEARPDLAGWYGEKYGEEPNYSGVLDKLTGSPADRCQLLESYFEPDEEDREEGSKLPTEAHGAIARLAAKDYVRVILTTNFDKLIERALEAEGVAPIVVSTGPAAAGATPLQHNRCTVIKVHGDYLDADVKNTPEELAKYHPSMDALLDKVFDEYGLVVCGWSGDYDTALREALKRSRSRRFTTYWASRGEPGETAREIVEFVRGRFSPSRTPTRFFESLRRRWRPSRSTGGTTRYQRRWRWRRSRSTLPTTSTGYGSTILRCG
jgi:hypothetical protein